MARTYTEGLNNFTDIGGFLTNVNNKVDQLMGVSSLFAIFLILLIIMMQKTGSGKQAFASSSAIGSMLAYLFFLAGLVAVHWVIVFIIATVGSTVWLYSSRD